MRVVSVNIGLPREVAWQGRVVRTSIWKNPVEGRIHVAGLNLDGDQPSDLTVHGGPDKAVYAYPAEHYAYWRKELPDADLPWGAFGENLTTEGLLEDRLLVGDRLGIASAEFSVTQPRMPCFKLGVRFGTPAMVKRFLQSRRTGFYMAVLREGEIGAGDAIEREANKEGGLTIADVVNLYSSDEQNQDLLRQAAGLSALPESWREYFRQRLWNADG